MKSIRCLLFFLANAPKKASRKRTLRQCRHWSLLTRPATTNWTKKSQTELTADIIIRARCSHFNPIPGDLVGLRHFFFAHNSPIFTYWLYSSFCRNFIRSLFPTRLGVSFLYFLVHFVYIMWADHLRGVTNINYCLWMNSPSMPKINGWRERNYEVSCGHERKGRQEVCCPICEYSEWKLCIIILV